MADAQDPRLTMTEQTEPHVSEGAIEAFVRRAAAEGTPAWVVELAISEGSPRWLDFLAGWEARDALAEEFAVAEGRAVEADELLYLAWTVIANAGGGNWHTESEEWEDAAVRWRDRWSASIAPARATGEEEIHDGE